ncbi:hypothetical protein ACQZ46_23830 [Agrobacterium salinitolerans]
MNDDEFEPGKAYVRRDGSDKWKELGTAVALLPGDGPVELRRRIPVTSIISISSGAEVDITDDFDLKHGISLTAVFPTMEEAQAFGRKWHRKEDT